MEWLGIVALLGLLFMIAWVSMLRDEWLQEAVKQEVDEIITRYDTYGKTNAQDYCSLIKHKYSSETMVDIALEVFQRRKDISIYIR